MNGENANSTVQPQTGHGSEHPQSGSPNLWSSTHAYGLSVICLLLGLGLGFLLRGSAKAPQPPVDPHAGHQHATSAAITPDSITPQQLQHMVDKTVQPFMEKLKQNPNDPKLLADVGNAYYAGQQFETAIEYYTKSTAIKPDANVFTQMSNAYHYAGSDDEALATLNKALEVDPTFANALFNLGMLKWRAKGDAAGAIKAWQKLLKTNPNHPNRRQVEQAIQRAKQQDS